MENQQHHRTTDKSNICLNHTGICAEVENLKLNVTELWAAINSIKRQNYITMTSVVIAMGTFILNLLVPFHKG
jgi:hypothetical protein